MTAQEVLAGLESRGVRVSERDGFLALRPRMALRKADLMALRQMKAEVLALLRTRQSSALPAVERVSLYQFDRILELVVPWSDLRLLIAPGCRVARELRASDPKPGRVWCVCEVLDLLLSGVTPDDARKISETRLTLDATFDGITEEPAPSEPEGKTS